MPENVPPRHTFACMRFRTSPDNALLTGVAAAIATICFGTSVVATRFVVAETQPVTLAFLRYTIGTACLLPVLQNVRWASMPKRDLLAMAALGVMFFGIFPWSFSAALTYIPSSRVAVELATMPLLTLLISRLRGYDRITFPKLLGQLLAFGGLFLALRPSATALPTDRHPWMGDVLTGVTALCGALYNVFSRPYLKRYAPLHVTALSMLCGVLFLAPIAALNGVFQSFPTFSGTAWLGLLFLGTFGGAFGFALWSWALQRSTPSGVAVFIALNPLTAITLGVLLLHEPVTTQFLLGFVGVIAGIMLANWQPVTTTAKPL
jgi:drug/metabolite transporter (DMT)-like permease